MGLKIIREVPLGPGVRSFGFENCEDQAEDQKQYDEGRTLEAGRFREGSLAQRVYDILSNPVLGEQKETRGAHRAGTAVAKQSAGSKVRRSAA